MVPWQSTPLASKPFQIVQFQINSRLQVRQLRMGTSLPSLQLLLKAVLCKSTSLPTLIMQKQNNNMGWRLCLAVARIYQIRLFNLCANPSQVAACTWEVYPVILSRFFSGFGNSTRTARRVFFVGRPCSFST